MRHWLALALLFALPIACGEEDSKEKADPICTPNQSIECACGTEKGSQTCDSNGFSYSKCSCDPEAGGSGGGSGSGGSGNECAPMGNLCGEDTPCCKGQCAVDTNGLSICIP